MRTIFDIGMFDGSDSEYYLECGFRVIAVEANQQLVSQAQHRFQGAIGNGQLICIHGAISPNGNPVELALSGNDLGSSSIFSERVQQKQPAGVTHSPGVTMQQLFALYGVPHYLKVDIEGADYLAVLALTAEDSPEYLSFEIGDRFEEMLLHIESIGYTRVKVIEQTSFRELENQARLWDRVKLRLMKTLGFDEPRMIKRAGRFFVRGHSSGPVPWLSDGRWHTVEEVRHRLDGAAKSQSLVGWYDLHATR